MRATLGVGVDADGRRVVGMDVWAARVLGFRGVEWDQSRGRSSDDEDDDVDARFGSRLTKTFTSFSITWMHRRVPPSFAQTSVVVFGRGRCERTGTLEMPRSARQTRRECASRDGGFDDKHRRETMEAFTYHPFRVACRSWIDVDDAVTGIHPLREGWRALAKAQQRVTETNLRLTSLFFLNSTDCTSAA